MTILLNSPVIAIRAYAGDDFTTGNGRHGPIKFLHKPTVRGDRARCLVLAVFVKQRDRNAIRRRRNCRFIIDWVADSHLDDEGPSLAMQLIGQFANKLCQPQPIRRRDLLEVDHKSRIATCIEVTTDLPDKCSAQSVRIQDVGNCSSIPSAIPLTVIGEVRINLEPWRILLDPVLGGCFLQRVDRRKGTLGVRDGEPLRDHDIEL